MRRARTVGLLALVACNRSATRSNADAPSPSASVAIDVPAVADAGPPTFAALGATSPNEKTPDGITVTTVAPRATDRLGALRLLRGSSKVLQFPHRSASDGARVYAAIDQDGTGFVVRDGVVYEDVLRRLGIAKGGCVAARDGELLVSGAVLTGERGNSTVIESNGQRTVRPYDKKGQAIFLVHGNGSQDKKMLADTFGTEDDCRAWLGEKGTWLVAGFRSATFDGTSIVEDRERYGGRLTIGSPTSKRYCFASCNAAEEAANPPETKTIKAKLGCEPGVFGWQAYEKWLVGSCKDRMVRATDGGALELVTGLPESKMLNGSYRVVFTASGDTIIGLEYGYRRYVVWKAGQATVGPIRTLGAGEVLADASPTFVLRGLGGTVPEGKIAAVLLGKDTGYGAGGSTYGYQDLDRPPTAYAAAFDRAKQVLQPKDPVLAYETYVDRDCGAYVRSPIGHEGMQIHDWTPPVLPPLSPKAVTRKPACVSFARVAALPGAPDLLLGLTSKKELHFAWLPPPLPLPSGISHFHPPPGGKAPPPPVQSPKPGTGWTAIGTADGFEQAIEGMPAPGGVTKVAPGTWQAGGAAIVKVGTAEILFAPNGAATLPPGTKPMAVATHEKLHAWGAIDGKLVDCVSPAGCRILDLHVPGATIIGVTPRSDHELIVKLADGNVGVYDVPPTGGTPVAQHPLASALEGALAKRPLDP